MRFNRKALEASALFCLVVATTTWKAGSGLWAHAAEARLWAHAAEATASVLILLNLFCFMRDGRRTR